MKTFTILALFVMQLLMSSCAINVAEHSQQAQLVPIEQADEPLTFRNEVQLSLTGGFYIRKLEQGSMWQAIGSIPQGRVYRSLGKVLMVASGNAHEAYLVIAQNAVVGAYLPVEHAFIAAKEPVSFLKGGNP